MKKKNKFPYQQQFLVILGVTEPAMFGINLKYVFPFLAAMIGSSIAAVISVGSGVMANSIGVGGIPGFYLSKFNI